MDWWLDETLYPGPRAQPGVVHIDLASGSSLVHREDDSGALQIIGTVTTPTHVRE